MFTVGTIANTHGVKGEVKIFPQTDFPEVRFAKGNELWLTHTLLQKPMRLQIEASRLQKNVYIVKFKDWNDINVVEQYKQGVLKVGEDDLMELPDDEFYIHEIVGCTVVTEEGEELGAISEVLSPGANDVWVVKRPKSKDLLLPYIDDVVKKVDIPNKKVIVHLMEGLI